MRSLATPFAALGFLICFRLLTHDTTPAVQSTDCDEARHTAALPPSQCDLANLDRRMCSDSVEESCSRDDLSRDERGKRDEDG